MLGPHFRLLAKFKIIPWEPQIADFRPALQPGLLEQHHLPFIQRDDINADVSAARRDGVDGTAENCFGHGGKGLAEEMDFGSRNPFREPHYNEGHLFRRRHFIGVRASRSPVTASASPSKSL